MLVYYIFGESLNFVNNQKIGKEKMEKVNESKKSQSLIKIKK